MPSPLCFPAPQSHGSGITNLEKRLRSQLGVYSFHTFGGVQANSKASYRQLVSRNSRRRSSSLWKLTALSLVTVRYPTCLQPKLQRGKVAVLHPFGRYSALDFWRLSPRLDSMVRSRRLELPRAFAHNDLNVARLPIPPRPLNHRGASGAPGG